ncbi:hypothetical protein ACWEOW_13375 [Monashia sp. NPDC004114]
MTDQSRTYTPAELLTYARRIAANFGLPEPQTAEDVERITGFPYDGPPPVEER